MLESRRAQMKWTYLRVINGKELGRCEVLWDGFHGIPLESGQWLSDGRLFDGAPIRLFHSMAEADAHAEQFPKQSQPHGVQFLIDGKGSVITARKSQKRPTGRHAWQQHR